MLERLREEAPQTYDYPAAPEDSGWAAKRQSRGVPVHSKASLR